MAKRKQIEEKYAGKTPPTAHLSHVPPDMASVEDATDCEPLEYDMEDECDDIAVSTSFASLAFTSSPSSVADFI
jgi:hypothetical protein